MANAQASAAAAAATFDASKPHCRFCATDRAAPNARGWCHSDDGAKHCLACWTAFYTGAAPDPAVTAALCPDGCPGCSGQRGAFPGSHGKKGALRLGKDTSSKYGAKKRTPSSGS